MNVFKKSLVASAIATAVLATGAAQAATVTNPSSGTVFSKTIVTEALKSKVEKGNTVINFVAGEGLNVDDSITFTLSAGKWKDIENADIADTNASATGYSLVEGGNGSASAKFRVTGADHATGAAFTVTLANTAIVDLTDVTGNVTITITMSGFVGGVATDLFGSPLTENAITQVPLATLAVTAPGTTPGIFDVATGFTQLTSGTSTDAAAPFDDSFSATATVTVNAADAIGNTITAATNNAEFATNVAVPAAAATAGKTIWKISGTMTGVDSITDTVGGLLTSATCTGDVTGTTANVFKIDTTNNEACAVGTAGAGGAPKPSFNFSTTTSHEATTYTIAVTRLADGDYSATSVGSATLDTFTRNGSAFASNSFGPLNKITVSDRSGALGGTGAADGAIALTVYDANGAAVTCSGLSIPNLASNSSVTIQGSDVASACPGAKRVEGTVNSNSILVTNVKTTSDGATATPALSSGGATAAQ